MPAIWPISDLQFGVANSKKGVIQAPEPGPRIMRYELTDFEWTAIRPFLPNKPHFHCPRPSAPRLRGRGRNKADGPVERWANDQIHACVDTNGMPVRLELTTGEAHDNRLVTELLSDLKSGAMLLADRGYDADWIRALAGEHGAWANIPPKRNRKDPICFSPYLYQARNLVERFNRIKQCRRVATRYDKLAANYLAFIKLAAIRIWLRAYESTP
jgi:transposase